MEVQYQLTPNDFYLLRRYWWRHKSKLKPWMIGLISLVVSILASIPALLQQPLRSSLATILTVSSAVILFLLIYSLSFKPLMKWLAKFVPGLLNPRHLTISEDCLTEQTSVAEIKVRWHQFVSLEEEGSTAYFFINNQQAFIIPRQAFPSSTEAEAFLNLARRYWDAAKQGTAVTLEGENVWPPAPRI